MAFSAELTRIPPVPLALGILGCLPLPAAALAQWIPIPCATPETARFAGLAYGVVILSFFGGIRWGLALSTASPSRQGTEIMLSILPALAGWIVLLLPPLLGVSLLLAGFLLQAERDVVSADRGILPQWFGKLEMLVTGAAVLALIALLLRLLS
jgi:hypothetical protein